MGVSKNLTVAIYGKGGAGKSFLTSMIAKELTARGKRVLQMGCDPKHDSVVTHFGGALIPTVLGTWAKFDADGRADELAPEDVMFKGGGVYCMELGGPESARGCGGRGITFGFQMLEKWGLSEWNFHYMLLDFLGDVVCGGFGTPIARSMADKLVIVCSNEAQSMYAANNIASAVRYFANNGGRTKCLGLFVNKDDGSGKAARMAEWLGIPVLAHLPLIPQDDVMPKGVPHPLIRDAVASVIASIDGREAVVPNAVDFVEFMMSLSGDARTMDGTAVTADELWTLGDNDPLAGLPNGGAPDRRYLESEDDAHRLLVPTIVSVGGGAVPGALGNRSGDAVSKQPSSMCPAFGAVRNLLRMEDAMPIVISSGDGCLYGHTFVAHFYVANRPIYSPGVSSEIWAKGSAFDELRSMVVEMAERHQPAIIPVCSLCVSDTVGLPFDLLPKQVGNTEVIYVPLPAYSVHTHARAKDIVVDSLVWRLPPQRKARAGVNLIGEIFPSDPIKIDEVLRKIGTHVNTTVPGPRWADYVAMVDGALNAPLHPFYSESVKRMKMKQGLPFVEGAPVGIDGTYRWIRAVGEALGLDEAVVETVACEERERVRLTMADYPLGGLTFMVAGYEGHEFLLVRLLIEAGANVPFLSTAVNANPLAREEERWLADHGCTVLYGANFEDEIRALTDRPYDCVVGTTPLCAHAKELGIPSIYYTNAIATRSLMLADGAAEVLGLVTQTVRAKSRYDRIARFFSEDETKPERTYTSWAPQIDLTSELIARGAL